MIYRFLLMGFLSILLAACSHIKESSDPGRYQHKQDFAPKGTKDIKNIPNAVPKIEPIRKAGNKSPYKVLGKVYYVLPTAKGYKARGKASWYGMKFQGHKTSNGEIYDIYGMTAAHKTLPIPSYVRVTNLANNRSVIVRVNDRGPFHDGRIIDLSYAAAAKLDYLNHGVADVLVEAIDVEQWQNQQNNKTPATGNSQQDLQIGAYQSFAAAQAVQDRLKQRFSYSARIEKGSDGLFRVKLGPMGQAQALTISERLQAAGFSKPMPIKVN